MPINRVFGLLWLVAALVVAFSAPTPTEASSGNEGPPQVLAVPAVIHHGGRAYAQNLRHGTNDSHEFAVRSTRRPHITVHPRRINPGPNAKRHCEFWLQKQYRVSGPVIVPEMRCWWQ